MNPYLHEGDITSTALQNKIKKNERAASDAMSLIAKRHRKLDPEECFEQIANTIGILAADLVRGGYDILGHDLATTMRDLVIYHMDRQISAIEQKEANSGSV